MENYKNTLKTNLKKKSYMHVYENWLVNSNFSITKISNESIK